MLARRGDTLGVSRERDFPEAGRHGGVGIHGHGLLVRHVAGVHAHLVHVPFADVPVIAADTSTGGVRDLVHRGQSRMHIYRW